MTLDPRYAVVCGLVAMTAGISIDDPAKGLAIGGLFCMLIGCVWFLVERVDL